MQQKRQAMATEITNRTNQPTPTALVSRKEDSLAELPPPAAGIPHACRVEHKSMVQGTTVALVTRVRLSADICSCARRLWSMQARRDKITGGREGDGRAGEAVDFARYPDTLPKPATRHHLSAVNQPSNGWNGCNSMDRGVGTDRRTGIHPVLGSAHSDVCGEKPPGPSAAAL